MKNESVALADAEQEKKKQALLLRNLYRSFVDNTFELIFRTSMDDKVLFSNKLFIQSLGFNTYRSTKGYSIITLFENPEEYLRLKERLLAENRIYRHVAKLKSLHGKIVITFINGQIQTNELGEQVVNWTALDISERVEFENNLEQKNIQLAKVNSQMEKFLYSTSHDLRAPLTTIMGLINLIRIESADKATATYVDKIEFSIKRLDKIMRDIISFSKTTYQNIHSERVDFEALVWKVINSHRGEANFNHIVADASVKGAAVFYNDTGRLEIILDNLIGNAIRFMDITKKRPFIHVVITINPDHASVEIHDNGIGIAPKHFDQIFNMFYKASAQSRGAGLGLFIAKEAAEQLGGTITVESEVGFGSIFRLFIPNSPKGRLINKKNQLEMKNSGAFD